ncbi:MAG TPA: transcriptional regulator [Gammaproteobacteria bacterium]|nr:transcriptional regulator [Gammaproteobacteria bacterium]
MSSTHKSATCILNVLDLLLRHTIHGLTATDIVRATGYSAPNVSRYLKTLEETGWAERIPETNRIRASLRVAQRAVNVMVEFDRAYERLNEIKNRITVKP